MNRIAEPVLTAVAGVQLKKKMPVEAREQERVHFTHLEVLGRLLAGMAPWLETPQLDVQEEGLLGLPSTNPFWQGEAEWTAWKAWGGNYTPIDQALLD